MIKKGEQAGSAFNGGGVGWDETQHWHHKRKKEFQEHWQPMTEFCCDNPPFTYLESNFCPFTILPFLIWLTMVELNSQALNESHEIQGYYACLHVSTSCIQILPSMRVPLTICDARI